MTRLTERPYAALASGDIRVGNPAELTIMTARSLQPGTASTYGGVALRPFLELAVAGGLAPGELLLDFPSRSSMLGVDLPLRLRGGGVDRLTDEGRAGQLGLPRVADELYRSARRLRLFVARPLVHSIEGLLGLLTLPAGELTRRLQERQPLL